MASHQNNDINIRGEDGDGTNVNDELDRLETIIPSTSSHDEINIEMEPSLTQSTSETEEERRRILEGIFAEEDEDEDVNLLSFMDVAQRQQQQQREREMEQGVQREDQEESGVGDVVDNGEIDCFPAVTSDDAGDDGYDQSSNADDGDVPPAEAPATLEQSPQNTTNPTQNFLPAAAAAAASQRNQRASENAYFSSSSEDEGDGQFFPQAVVSPGVDLIEQQDQDQPAITPKFSNTNNYTFGEDKPSLQSQQQQQQHQQQHQQQQPDLASAEGVGKSYDSTNPAFSWIHSAEDDEEGALLRPQPTQDTLNFQMSEDTASFAGFGTGNAPTTNVQATTNERRQEQMALDAAMANLNNKVPPGSKSNSRDSSPSHQRQQREQQSAFDRALNEVQQKKGGRGALSTTKSNNSFNFSNVSLSGGESGSDAGSDVAGVTGPSTSTNEEIALGTTGEGQEGEERSLSASEKKDGGQDEDDFFAKAEHTVLDEILSENVTVEEEESISSKQTTKESSASKSTIGKSGNNITKSTPPTSANARVKDRISLHTNRNTSTNNTQSGTTTNPLPDVLNSMRQKIESFNIFDGDSSSNKSSIAPPSLSNIPNASLGSGIGGGDGMSIGSGGPNNAHSSHHPANMLLMDTTSANSSTAPETLQKYYNSEEEREAMRRAFQQSISAAVLVSLAHKRYERRRLAAMEIEKVVRSLVVQEDYGRVRAILLLLSDDYVRSTNEDARKGGAVALAACAIGLKKANEGRRDVTECRDLILASVVHACQDHSQRVRYYATESLFNVTKVIPSLAVQHFFILFEILRSLYADVDLDVRSGAELLDKKLKEVIVGAINSGSFSADACVPVFARFVYMRNKATKQLTLTWLKEFSEKLVGAPILEFLHLFLGGIFAMVADPNATIRQLALEFLQSVLPKLLVNNEDFEDAQQKVDFDKILQSLVLTMEHPDPFVRKVAMYWMSRIVQAHMSSAFPSNNELSQHGRVGEDGRPDATTVGGVGTSKSMTGERLTAASISVRNALPHVLPGILLSIGDTHQSRGSAASKDSFLPDQTTHSLAEQANTCLQDAVRRDGRAFIPHLGGFIVALREELDSPGGLIARNPPSVERRPYRMDVKADGSGIESTGWFRASDGVEERDNALILSRLCALQWVVVLYEHVVPNSLKADYAGEFVDCIIYQLVDQPPGIIIVKSFEVLAKISNPAEGEESYSLLSSASLIDDDDTETPSKIHLPSKQNPMNDESAIFALGILEPSRRKLLSRDRSVFASLIDLHSKHQKLLMDISKVIELMCTLQPPEFVFVSFAYELDNFIVSRMKRREKLLQSPEVDNQMVKQELASFAKDLAFVSNFAQQLGIVFFAAPETEVLRDVLKDSIGFKGDTVGDERKARLFHILLHTFSHNIVATLAFCLWGGAFLTASTFLQKIDPLDVSLMFYLELDQLIDLIERPLFRHLHLRMLECEDDPHQEGSGAMLFRTLKSIMMLLPQSTSYMILKERLTSMARYRQSAVALSGLSKHINPGSETDVFVKRITSVRRLHCDAKWRNIRAESLEEPCRFVGEDQKLTAAQQRREWLGYADEAEELASKAQIKEKLLGEIPKKAEMVGVYENLDDMQTTQLTEYKDNNEEECDTCVTSPTTKGLIRRFERMSSGGDEEKEDRGANPQWREYWASRQ